MGSGVSRRQFFQGGGAALVGATVLASTSAPAVASAGAAGAAQVLPSARQVLVIPVLDFFTVDNNPTPGLAAPPRRYATSQSFLEAAVRLPTGATIHGVEVFGYNDVNTQQLWQLVRFTLGTDSAIMLGDLTLDGTGLVSGTIEFLPQTPAPYTIGADEYLVVALANADATTAAVGAEVTYSVPTAPSLVPISPRRVYDSRTSGTKLAPGEERTISVAAAADGSGEVVPAGATAVAITFTVTATEGADGGFAAVYPAGAAWAGTSSVNWFGVGQNMATAAIVGLGGDRSITVRGGVAATHCVVDVSAYLI